MLIWALKPALTSMPPEIGETTSEGAGACASFTSTGVQRLEMPGARLVWVGVWLSRLRGIGAPVVWISEIGLTGA